MVIHGRHTTDGWWLLYEQQLRSGSAAPPGTAKRCPPARLSRPQVGYHDGRPQPTT